MIAFALLCCLLPVLLVILFAAYTVFFNEHWNRLLDRVFPGRHPPR